MDIHTINAESKLTELAMSIGKNPASWRGWHALYIDLAGGESRDFRADEAEESLIWIKSVLESYLNGIETHLYICHDRFVHILCHHKDPGILRESARQIGACLLETTGLHIKDEIYDLAKAGYSYIRNILDDDETDRSIKLLKETLQQARSSTPETNANAPLKVLLIEDDPVTRWMVDNALKEECDFTAVSSAGQAFSTIRTLRPDLVFLDIGLPDTNGKTLLEWITQNTPDTRVVMFSSSNNLENITKTLNNGASGFIAKPFMKEQLLEYIRPPETKLAS